MEKTTYFELNKPGYSDKRDIKPISDNMDIIDGALHDLKYWGSGNSGKFLVVGSDGNLTLLAVASASGGTY